MSHINERWVAIDGSVYTEVMYTRQAPGGEVKYRPGIAFNVGQMVAEHMVRMHNASLNPRHIKAVLDGLPAKVLAEALVRRDETFMAFFSPDDTADHDAARWNALINGDVENLLVADDSCRHDVRLCIEPDEITRRVDQHLERIRAIDSQASRAEATGMSSVMQVQGSSLRPVEIGQAVVASEPAAKPCCGCRKV